MAAPSTTRCNPELLSPLMDGQDEHTATGHLSHHVGYSLINPSLALNETVDRESHAYNIQPVGPHDASFLNTVAKRLSTRHLFLQGPPKSGRSSLVMNLACELAATTPCRCPHRVAGDTAADNSPCSCIAVVLFLPATDDNSSFPLHCQSVSNSTAMRFAGSKQEQQRTGRTLFAKYLLRRIQVRRIASVHDLLQQLWSIQGSSALHQQPNALLLDDLDKICSTVLPQPREVFATATDPVKIRARESLVLATLLDSANWLTRLQNQQQSSNAVLPRPPVFVLATTSVSEDSTSVVSSFSLSVTESSTDRSSSHWQPLLLRSGGLSSSSSVLTDSVVDENEVVVSRWMLQPQGQSTIGEYTVLQSLERGWRILWACLEEDKT